jgi:hypothetical protein
MNNQISQKEKENIPREQKAGINAKELNKTIALLEEQLENAQNEKNHFKKELKGLQMQLKDAGIHAQQFMEVRR